MVSRVTSSPKVFSALEMLYATPDTAVFTPKKG